MAGAPIGSPVTAVDPDGDTLTYTWKGRTRTRSTSTSGSGQIRTSAELNHEEKSSYSVTVRATDGRGGTDAVNVTIRVTDVDNEPPDTPFAPTVTAVSSTSIAGELGRAGEHRPAHHRLRLPVPGGVGILDGGHQYDDHGNDGDDSGTDASTSYDVEVRAKNAEGTSDWSNPGIGSTNAPGANNPPVFTEGTSATRSVSASAPAGTLIGAPVTATDADSGDTLTYSLEGRDAASFDINDTTGQLLTKSGITLIVDETYTVTVAADDGRDIAEDFGYD